MNENKQATHTSLPKQDPAAYVPGTPTVGQYQPMSAPRCRPTPLTRTEECGFWKGFDYGLPSWPSAGGAPQVAPRPTAHVTPSRLATRTALSYIRPEPPRATATSTS